MARRIIEGTWDCTSCDRVGILGRHKICPSCGNPREQRESTFDFGQRAPEVRDAELVDLARAGRDWFCPQCNTGNRGDGAVCKQCGGARGAAIGAARPVVTPRRDPRSTAGIRRLLAVAMS
ncbi:MAG: hypothetical protein ABMB14_20895, partial [Myxococcota bacterium]